MTFLLKKMLRDIKKNWMQFVTVFLMSALSVTIFSGMASVWHGMDKEVKSYSEKTNLADVWIYGAGIDEEDVDKIKKLDGVEDVTLSSEVPSTLKSGNGNVKLISVNNDKVIKPLSMSGEKWSYKGNGIYLDNSFAKANDFKVGDSIDLKIGGLEKSFKIKGTVLHSEYIYYTGSVTETIPNDEEYGYAFISEDSMKEITQKIFYNEAKVKADKKIDSSDIENILGDKYRGFLERKDIISYEQVQKESEQIKKMSMLFSAVFVMLALLTMYTSMVRLISNQITIIGTMKALGIKSRNIRIHYALYGLIIPLMGGLIGILIGRFLVSDALLEVKKSTLTLPEWRLEHSSYSFILIGIIILICMFASVWASSRGLKGMPAETMRGDVGSIEAKQNIIEKAPFLWNRISYYWRWVLRDISRNKARFTMGVIGVMGGLVLIISGIGIRDSIIYSNDYVFDYQLKYDTKGVLAKPGVKLDLKEEHQYIMENAVEIKKSGIEKRGIIIACEQGDLLLFNDQSDKRIDLSSSGILMNKMIAEDLGVVEGDEVEIRVQGKKDWEKIKINKLTKNLSPQGIVMSDKEYEKIYGEFVPNSVAVKNMTELELKNMDEVSSAISIDRQTENLDMILESVMSIVKLLIMASVLLSVVILYNLGALNLIERTREYATLKVLGFYQVEIRGIAIKDCILSTFIGLIFGLPLGIKFLGIYVKTVSFDSFEWLTQIKPLTIAISIVVVVGTAMVINLILSSKVRKINMAEALKSVE